MPGPDVVVRALCQLLGVGHERRSAARPPFPQMVWESVREGQRARTSCGASSRRSRRAVSCSSSWRAEAVRSRLRLANAQPRGRRAPAPPPPADRLEPAQCGGEQLDGQLAEAGWLDPSVQPFGGWALALVAESMCRFLSRPRARALPAARDADDLLVYRLALRAALPAAHRGADAATAVFAKPPDKKVANKKKSKPAKPPVVGANGSRQRLALRPRVRERRRRRSCCCGTPTAPASAGSRRRRTPSSRRRRARRAPLPRLRLRAEAGAADELTPTTRASSISLRRDGDERPAQGRERLASRRRRPPSTSRRHQPVAPLKDGEKAELTALARVAVANAVCVGSLQQAPPSAAAKLTFSWAARALARASRSSD